MHVVAGYWLSRAVYLAARLKLADAVGARATLDALAAATGTRPAYRSEAEVQAMYRHAEAIIYPKRAEKVMQEP